MPSQNISFFTPFDFSASAIKNNIQVKPVSMESFEPNITPQHKEVGFTAKPGQIFIEREDGHIKYILAGVSNDFTYQDGGEIYQGLRAAIGEDFLKDTAFSFDDNEIEERALERLSVGWGWSAYSFDLYKKEKAPAPLQLSLSEKTDEKRIKAFVESVCLTRDLVNIPANDMGPDELEDIAEIVAQHHKASFEVIKDEDLIEQNFPMIFDVGRASTRRPRLLDMSWGDTKNPKVTLVGKGVCFDTGGLDLKPSKFMLLMKKDMGGSAQVLGLAHLIMSLNLPINLRVLIPAVENAVDGNAYRPSDILNSRKGITVEVGNTDAEGRLVLADAISYACEDKPELLIDFATLTGAARVAVGYDLPGLFSNNQETARQLQDSSAVTDISDPVWHLPLWPGYRKDLDSPNADISSTGGQAGATTAALFLQEFVDADVEWIHLDCYAWEQNGHAARPKGGADTGFRAIFNMLEQRYSK